MKKYIKLLFIAVSVSFLSCETETDPGGTAVEKMAGDWIVTWEAKNPDGEWEDVLGGTVLLNTYNTAANIPTEMWLKETYLLKKAFKVSVNYNARRFDASEVIKMNSSAFGGDIEFTAEDGRVLEGAATTPSGMPADSIVFFLNVKDDDVYKIAGFRRTGFPADE